ncbi:hypothetical protein [Haloarcula sp. JP-L23]|uniref:hypothetical protein n=1 Tax=Haloarcula sp. JP-L23 TaxID=2716717 RepID=UPI00140F3CE0|nr:hypothetical protein G9465_19275 [Haloarcula sp. JP-L23]
MGGKRARQILDSDGDLPSSDASITVDRAMDHVVGKSYFPGEECECAKQDCEHTMFSQSIEDGYTLSVGRETWETYLEQSPPPLTRMSASVSPMTTVKTRPRKPSGCDYGA